MSFFVVALNMFLYVLSESRCVLLPVVLRLLHTHLQEQKELVLCANILGSMLTLNIPTTVSLTQTLRHHLLSSVSHISALLFSAVFILHTAIFLFSAQFHSNLLYSFSKYSFLETQALIFSIFKYVRARSFCVRQLIHLVRD